MKVVKNKMAPPFREVEFDILYGQGISRSGDVIDLAADLGIVEKSGAWFSFGGERIGQGRENAKAYLEQHPELIDKLEAHDPRQARHQARRGRRRRMAQRIREEDALAARPAPGADEKGERQGAPRGQARELTAPAERSSGSASWFIARTERLRAVLRAALHHAPRSRGGPRGERQGLRPRAHRSGRERVRDVARAAPRGGRGAAT